MLFGQIRQKKWRKRLNFWYMDPMDLQGLSSWNLMVFIFIQADQVFVCSPSTILPRCAQCTSGGAQLVCLCVKSPCAKFRVQQCFSAPSAVAYFFIFESVWNSTIFNFRPLWIFLDTLLTARAGMGFVHVLRVRSLAQPAARPNGLPVHVPAWVRCLWAPVNPPVWTIESLFHW